MRRRRWLISFVGLVCGSFASGATPSWRDTIEAQAAYADQVVIGTIVSITPPLAPAQHDLPLASSPFTLSIPTVHRASIRVVETLKGPVRDVVFWTEARELPQTRAVFFLSASSRALALSASSKSLIPTNDLVLDDSVEFDSANFPSGRSHGVITTSMRNGLSESEVIENIRSHCCFGLVTKYQSIESGLEYPDGWSCLVEVPLDAPTFGIARKWAHFPDSRSRWNAALVLKNLPNTENARALVSLADIHPTSLEDWLAREVARDTLHRTQGNVSINHSAIPITIVISLAAMIVGTICAMWRAKGSSRKVTIATAAAIVVVGSSFFSGVGLSGGKSQIYFWRGELILIRREHSSLTNAMAWKLDGNDDRWSAASLFHPTGFEFFPGKAADGVLDGGDDVISGWTSISAISIPILPLLVTALILTLLMRWIATAKRLADSRRPAFPVSNGVGVTDSTSTVGM